MALNYSHRPIFPARLPEENMVQGGSQDRDIRELLPADPFGMHIITEWLEDLNMGTDYGCGYRGDNNIGGGVSVGKGDYPVLAGWNIFWNAEAMEFQTLYLDGIMTNDSPVYGNGNDWNNVDDDDGSPHQALSFALGYLGIRDLLSVERVCKSLRDAVQNDCLLWRNVHIDQPLNDRITDDVLLQLTNRAQGRLHCLSLVGCQRITDDGLKRVLNANPMLVKLSVPGCLRLSIDGVVNGIRAFQEGAVNGIKFLRVGGLYGVTHKHFEELMSLMGIDDNHVQVNRYKPHFYRRENVYLSYEDDRPIDIEMCPSCQNLRLVYDCPAECCQSNDHATQICRACTFCIPRCFQCGTCINDNVYVETFCLESVCSDCWNQGSQSQERQDVGTSPCNHAISEEEPVVLSHG